MSKQIGIKTDKGYIAGVVPYMKEVWTGEVATGEDGSVWTDIAINFDITDGTEFIVQIKELSVGQIDNPRCYIQTDGKVNTLVFGKYSNTGSNLYSIPVKYKDKNTLSFSAARTSNVNVYNSVVIQGIWAVIK